MVMKKREQVFALLLHLQCLLFPVDALLFMQQERLRSLHLCAWNEELPESVVSSLADRGVTSSTLRLESMHTSSNDTNLHDFGCMLAHMKYVG
mmetsp:Transcript_22174/g.28699  ORF Transcript_22174/g.28699 Transcript_22174/m.28699 type:complete len:93 (+) Transcript_22174:42-320(+)